MGLLALGGAIGGAGQGMQQGLHTLQTGIQQAGLTKDDQDFQMKKLQVQQDFESQREQRGYAHTETMAKQSQDFQAAQNEGNHQFQAAQDEVKGVRDAGEKEKDRQLKGRELDIAKNAQVAKGHYYEAYAKYLNDGGKNGASGSKVDMEAKKAGAAFYSSRIQPLEKQLIDPMTPEKDKQAISDRIEQLSKEGLEILGFTFGKDKPESPQVKLQNGDPFPGASPLSRGGDSSGATSTASTPAQNEAPPAPSAGLQTVERTRPVMPRGSASSGLIGKIGTQQLDYDVQQKLEELNQAKIHGNAARVQYLQKQYDALVAQQKAGAQ